MGFFDFLGNAGQAVGNGLQSLGKAESNAAPKIFNFLKATSPAYNIYKDIAGGAAGREESKQNALNLIHGGTRPVAEAVTSLHPGPTQYTPGSAAEKLVFGDTPVQNIQKKVVTTYQQHPGGGAIPLAAGEAAWSFIQDIPAVEGVAKGIGVGLKGIGPAADAFINAGDHLPKFGNEIGAIGKDVNPATDIHIPIGDAGHLRISQEELSNLAKAKSASEVKSIIGDALPQDIVDRVAPSIALTKDPNTIASIFDKATPAPSPLPVPESPSLSVATPVSKPTVVAGKGTEPRDITAIPEAQVLAPGTRQRSYLETLANSKNSTPELSTGVKEINPQTYEVKSNQALADSAKKVVADNYDAALEQVKTTKNLTDNDVAIGQELIRKAQSEGRVGDAVDIVEHLDTKLRESGRAVQAASLWDKLSPEGILRLAERKIRTTREGYKGVAQEGDTATEIKNAVEGSARLDRGDVTNTIKEIANTKIPKEELTTGQKVAKRVETAVTPQVKKKADLLVDELTKKVKQELLPEKAKGTPPSAIKVLREVFGRNKEAQEAFPEAQRILQERFAGNPKALATLDKFFHSELGLPAADTTISRALREQLKVNGESISNIIYKSIAEQKNSVEEISQSLVKEGFDKSSADTLAKEVSTRLNKQLGEAKATVLQRLAEDAKPKAQTTYLDKLNKLSNLGALGDADYLQIARAKLDLPQLTTETASQLTELSQKLQGLGENDPARYETIRQIGEVIQKAAPPSPPSKLYQLLGTPKALLASEDISGAGRQGSFLGTRFPEEYKNAFASQVRYFADENAFNKDMATIAADQRFPLMMRAKLALTGVKEFGHPEEAFTPSWAEKVPGVGRSDRGYTGALTKERADVFNHIMDNLEASGIDVNNMPKSHIESLGRYINTASGRGDLGPFLEKHAQSLGEALFSPRLWKSRLDVLNPKYYYDLKGPARSLALQNLASFSSTAATILGLAAAAGAQVETDARSSDFLKIKVGNTRFDILGGFGQNIVLLHRELPGSIFGQRTYIGSGEKKNSQTGAVTKLGSQYGGADRLTTLGDFIQNKENPVLGTGSRILKGKDIGGNPVNPATEVAKLFIPLGFQDTYSAIKDSGPVSGTLKSLPGYLGVGNQTYSASLNSKQNSIIKNLKTSGASPEKITAYTEYYKIASVAKGKRDNVSEAINKALAAGNTAKAQQLAKDYNSQYGSQFKDWVTKYGKYGDSTLSKDYNSNKIKLTSSSIKSRLKVIKANNVLSSISNPGG